MATLFEGLTKEQMEILQKDPRQYIRNRWRHPNDPSRRYDFKDTNGEQKVNYLLHPDGPLNPESWGNINVLKFARGCLKSTTMRMISNWALHMYLMYGIEIYMTAPREGQITNFTDDLKSNITNSGLSQHRTKNNNMFQKFQIIQQDEGSDQTYEVNTKFEADSGWGDGDALRGPHSHMGIIDEFQDISKPAFDTYMQCIDQDLPSTPYFPCIFVLGTPKLTSSFYHDLWERTDQKTWIQDDLNWKVQSTPDYYLPDDADEEELTNEEKDEIGWSVRGWHVDQYNSPLHDERAISRDKASYSKMKFANEIEAKFYSPEDNLLSKKHIENIYDDELGFSSGRKDDDSFVVLAADWGGGADRNAADTVFGVGEWTEFDDESVQCELLDIEFKSDVKRLEVLRDYEQWIKDYDIDIGVVDYGHSEGMMEDLQNGDNLINEDGYIDTVKACRFGNIKDKTDIKWEQNSGKRRFFTADKTRVTTRMVDAVKQEEFVIPKQNLNYGTADANGDKLENQLTAAYKEMKDNPSGGKKISIEKEDGRNDDAMDVFTYLWIGYHELGSQNRLTRVNTTKRAGYG